MPKIDLKSIKAASIKSVFRAIADREKSTRAEIAQATGLSLMTVGKIADSFSALGITSEEKEASSSVGRRAAVIRTTDTYYSILLDLTSSTYKCEIMNAGTGTIDRFSYAPGREFYPEENLLLFLKNLSLHLTNRYFPEYCMGIGIVLPDNPTPADEDVLRNLPQYIHSTLPEFASRTVAESQTEASAFYSTYKRPESSGHVLLYCRPIGELSSALVIDGTVLKGQNRAVGNMALWAEMGGFSRQETVQSIAAIIRRACALLDPHEIMLEANAADEGQLKEISDQLLKTFVESGSKPPTLRLSIGGARNACAGLSIKLRELWLHQIISQEI